MFQFFSMNDLILKMTPENRSKTFFLPGGMGLSKMLATGNFARLLNLILIII